MSPRPSLLAAIRSRGSLVYVSAFAWSTARAGCDVQAGGAIVNDSVVTGSGASAAINAPSTAISVTPLAVPNGIRNPLALDGDGVSFDTPLLGTPILDYSALCMPGALSFTQVTSPIVLTPLNNNVDCSCAVTARNSLGSGPAVNVCLRPTAQLFANGFE